jgi:uncharacterized protein YbjT (DUF2867 family)
LLTVGSNPEGIVARAREAGVNAVVLLSSQGAGTRPDAYRHARSFEDALTASGLAWTIVRPSGFASNTRMWASAIRERRAVFAPFGDVALPVIHPADIVETLVTILLSYRAPDATSKHMGRTYELTGPESVSPRQQTSAIAKALGMEIEFIELTPDAARANLLRVMPEDVTDATLAVLGSPTVEESTPTHDVSEVLGRPSATFADWAAENRQAFG